MFTGGWLVELVWMKVNPEIFRAYDIRGLAGKDVTPELAEQIGRAFASHLRPSRVVVGRDVRLSGPKLHAATIRGISAMGVDVLDVGVVGTDEYYFACGSYGLPGIMVTASHNPPEYNGFKMVKKMPEILLATEFMELVANKSYQDAPKAGGIQKLSIHQPFIEHILKLIPPSSIKPLKVVIDTSNGALGPVWENLAVKLPIKLVPLFFEQDGNFPNHGNDIIQPENQAKLRESVVKSQADLGLIFDPDGDRCLAVDDRGRSVPGDFLTAMMAAQMLKRQPGSAVIYDIRASQAVPDLIKQAGGQPVVWKVGHAYIKPKMVEYDAIFGGEVSGHFYFKNFFYSDSGVLAALTLLQYVSNLPGKFSQRVVELESKYFLSGEINSTVVSCPVVFDALKAKYADGELNELDGVSITYPDWHFTVRASNNEPLIRLTLEASSHQLMEQKRDEVLAIIRAN